MRPVVEPITEALPKLWRHGGAPPPTPLIFGEPSQKQAKGGRAAIIFATLLGLLCLTIVIGAVVLLHH